MSTGTVVQVTIAEFERFIAQPENAERRFELVGGEIVEVVSNNYASIVAFNIGFHIKLHMRDHNIGGDVTGEAGGYIVAGERYIPDVGFISRARQPEPSHDAYNPNAPDLAVEVLSPTDRPELTRVKVANYMSAGTVVWLVDPDAQTVEIYAPGQKAQRLGAEDVIDGGEVLPGFALKVEEIFPK